MEIEEHVVRSPSRDFSRRVWLARSSSGGSGSSGTRLCIFLDGEYYLHRMEAASVVAGLEATGAVAPLTCLFLSHQNAAARHHDYACSPDYARFVVQDVLGWVESRDRGLVANAPILCGLSLSGLASAYAAITHSGVFSSVLCQSGSFWWNDEWLTKHLATRDSVPGLFWVSVGDDETETGVSHAPTGMRQEVSQVRAAENFFDALRSRGAAAHFHRFSGGHDLARWKEELPAALQWLTSGDTAASGR